MTTEKILPLPGLGEVTHMGFTVLDLGAATAFLTGVLGFTLISQHGPLDSRHDHRMADVFGVHPRAAVRYAFLRHGAVTVELAEWDVPDQNRNAPLNSDLGGRHLALYVQDLPGAVDRLREMQDLRVLAP